MRSLRVCVAASFIGMSAAASAADLPLKAPIATTISQSWTGFYIGGSAGYGFHNDSVAISGNTPLISGLINVASIPRTLSTDQKGWLGGLQAGYNYQIVRILLGLEADLSLTDFAGSARVTNPGPVLPFATYTTTVEQRMQWFGTVRGRAGFTPLDRLLVYATGGLAVGRIDYGGNIHRSAILLNFDVPASTTVTKTGWTIGGGAEYALSNEWSVKGEYLYYDLGSETLTGLQIPKPIILTQNSASYAFVTRGSIVRVGLNFRID